MAVTYSIVAVSRTPQSSGPPVLTPMGPVFGQLSYTTSLEGPDEVEVVTQVDSLQDDIKARLLDLYSYPMELWVYRDADMVFAGPVLGGDLKDDQFTFWCRGLLTYLQYMVIDDDFTFLGNEQFSIVTTLIDNWQDQTYGNFGIDTSSVGTSGQSRVVSYRGVEKHLVWEEIKILAEAAGSGFDIHVDPESRKLVLSYPTRGTDKSTAVFLERGIKSSNVKFSVAPDVVATTVFGIGTSADNLGLEATATETGDLSKFGRAGAVVHVDHGPSEQSFLNDFTAAHLDYRKQFVFVPGPGLAPVDGAMVDDFEVGDTVSYSHDAGLGLQTGSYRVIKKKVNVNDGNETMEVEFARRARSLVDIMEEHQVDLSHLKGTLTRIERSIGAITGGTYQGGNITIASGSDLLSSDYIADTQGWIIKGSGDAEFNSVEVRGALIAGAGSIIDGAYISNLTVDWADIQNVSIVNADINDLDASKINAGTLNAARIGAGSITASKIDIDGTISFGTTGQFHTAASAMKIGNNINGTNDGIYINANNYWYDTGVFKLGGGGTDYVQYTGGTLTIRGTLNADDINAGTLAAARIAAASITAAKINIDGAISFGSTGRFDTDGGAMKIGNNVNGTNDGIYINANNYWYDTGVWEIGTSSKGVKWDNANFELQDMDVTGTLQMKSGSILEFSAGTGIFRTASSGQRVEISASEKNTIKIYSGIGTRESTIAANDTDFWLEPPSGANLLLYGGSGTGGEVHLIQNSTAKVKLTNTYFSVSGGYNFYDGGYARGAGGSAANPGWGFSVGGVGMSYYTSYLRFSIGSSDRLTFSTTELNATMTAYFLGGGSMATGSGNDLQINATTGQLLEVTSSRLAKKNIKSLVIGNLFDQLRPVEHRYKADVVAEDRPYFSFIAEEAAEISPSLARYKNGVPVNVDDRAILALTVAKVQSLESRLAILESINQ